MKKLLACLLALAIFALPALAEPRSYLDYTDDILEDGSPIYYFMELSLKLPAEWRGKVFAMAEDSGVGFYQRASYDASLADGFEGGGFLFRLGCSVNHSFDQLPSFRYLGFSEESALNYYLELPSDYRAYGGDEARAEYDAMFAQIDDVVENAAFYADQPEPQDQSQDDSAAQGVTLEQARYHFEHNALPRYFYDDPANVIDVLSQNGIPCEMEGRLGSGISTLVGYSQESYRFFVPYECLPTACDLVEQLFGGKYEPEQEEAQEESASEEEEE